MVYIPVLQPATLRRNSQDVQKSQQAQEAYQTLSQLEFDAMVVVAYGLILPQEVLDIGERPGRYGSFNIHASLLPRWRGAAPIQRAIEAGDTKTGVCIMQMDAGLDTGDTVLVKELEISSTETSATLHDKLARLGATLIVKILAQIESGESLVRTPQASAGVTYAEKILKTEAEVDCRLAAKQIDARIRAFNPFPGATSLLDGQAIKLWNSAVVNDAANTSQMPGDILGFSDRGIYVQCGSGVIEILELQKPGGKKLDAKTVLQTLNTDKALRFQTKAE